MTTDTRRYTPHCRCGAHWTGTSAAHCAQCHHTFTSTAGFTRHRRNDQCLTPESIGMVPAARDYPAWSLPGTWDGPDTTA